MAPSRTGPGVQRGQATVEFVLVLPVMISLVLIVVQIGIVTRDRLLLAHTAREAARAAAVDPSPATATAAAEMATGLKAERLTVELGSSRATGDRLTVRVRYASPTDVPLIGLALPDVMLETEVTVRVE